jgi:hypothetical protein
MSGAEGQHELEALLAEQTAYYRARAPEYLDDALEELGRDVLAGAGRELLAALDGFAPRRDVLELAGALKPDGRVLFVDDAYRRLADAGWSCRVTAVSGPFFWGEGRPTVSIQNV